MPPRVLPGFLTEGEQAELEAFYRDALAARRFVRHRTREYNVIEVGELAPGLCQRARAELGYAPAVHRIHTLMLAYAHGDGAPPHTDWPRRVLRLNALVVAARAGGVFKVGGEAIELAPRDAVIFEPARHRHELTPVVGERAIWSLGLIPRRY